MRILIKPIIVSLLLILVLNNCKEDESNPVDKQDKTPIINSITPDSGWIGTEITITGKNFCNNQENSIVSFNNTNGTEYISWSDTSIIVKVPSGATTGAVHLTVNQLISNDINFVVNIEPMNYESVTIGNQIWMLRNLEVTKYKNGDSIRHCTTLAEWRDANNNEEGAWGYYKNDSTYGQQYGLLYNGYAVSDPRGLAPAGWHIPTREEWIELISFLGWYTLAGGEMKESGTLHWMEPNTGATNNSGFTALPGGCGSHTFGYIGAGTSLFLWSSTESKDKRSLYSYYLNYSTTKVEYMSYAKINLFSARCVED